MEKLLGKLLPEFKELTDKLPTLLKQLIDSPLRPCNHLGNVPAHGIYVFYEQGTPIYVGRSNRMKARIQEHKRPSSTHNSASFAFNLARDLAKEQGVNTDIITRENLENDPCFKKFFSEAKERVSQMSVRYIEIDDSVLQSVFEIYCHLALKTEYNDFDTH